MTKYSWPNHLAWLISLLFHPIHSFLYWLLFANELSLALFLGTYIFPIISIYLFFNRFKNFNLNVLNLFQRRGTYLIQLFWNLLAIFFFIEPRFTDAKATLYVSVALLLIMFGIEFWKRTSLHIAGSVALLGLILYSGFTNIVLVGFMLVGIAAIAWARLRLKAHTPEEILRGVVVGLVSFALAAVIF